MVDKFNILLLCANIPIFQKKDVKNEWEEMKRNR